MNDALNELLTCLKEERPAVLFLGQDAWKSGRDEDPILLALLDRLGREGDIQQGWNAALSGGGLDEWDMDWLAERYDRNVVSDSMQALLDVAWSAVFTTSFDQKLARRLETRGRQPESVMAKDHFARVPRSRYRPPIHYILGRCNEKSKDLKAPHNLKELKKRILVHGNNFINRIPETVTPLGVLVIEGYSPDKDLLGIDDFLASLSALGEMRILWFGASPDIKSEFFSELVENGMILPVTNRLVDFVTMHKAKETEEDWGSTVSDEPGIISLDAGKYIDASPSLRLRVEASAAIVDDDWTSNVTALDDISKKEAFYRFHGDLCSTRSLVEGVARGFAIRRDFEQLLRTQVEGTLKDQGNLGRFVILHGQSGTGKTVALARLALELRSTFRLPVLFSRGRIPQATDVDDFCAEAEKAGAPGTVILCDANQSVSRYRDLSNALRSRGRRIAVVGTTYKLEGSNYTDADQVVEAPAEMSKSEIQSLKLLVTEYSYDKTSIDFSVIDSTHALALLYRLLAPGRERITAGVSGEARAIEEVVRLRARSIPRAVRFNSVLADKLIAAGVRSETFTLFEEDEYKATLGTDTAGRLIDYVMVVGRVDCPVPVNLLIRTLTRLDNDLDLVQISYLFNDIDLFRWRFIDPEGNSVFISPRVQLEAELICRRRLADKNKEIQYIVELIESVRPSDVDRMSELYFLLDLLYKLDDKGPRGDEYCDGHLVIARALSKLRTENKIEDARIMLQESSFRRSFLRYQDRMGESAILTDQLRYKILNEAREVVEVAIRQIEDGNLRAGRRTKEYLHVERASIYGYLAVGRAKSHASQDQIWSDYVAARNAITQAIAVADSYFPVDLALWTPVDVLKVCELDLPKRVEMAADMYSILDQVDPGRLSAGQKEKLLVRKTQIAQVLNDDTLGEDALKILQETSPATAIFIQARNLGSSALVDTKAPFPQSVRKEAKSAADFIKSHLDTLSSDPRCLTLLLQLEWASITGDRLLRGERRPLPHEIDDIKQVRNVVASLNRVAGESARFIYRFLEATLEWMCGQTAIAEEIWRSLANDTEYEDPSRVVRRLYVADSEGKPVVFRGRVERARGEGRWLVHVDGMPGKIGLLDRDFKHEDLQPGRELQNFAISFNYVGPIADSISRFGGR